MWHINRTIGNEYEQQKHQQRAVNFTVLNMSKEKIEHNHQ